MPKKETDLEPCRYCQSAECDRQAAFESMGRGELGSIDRYGDAMEACKARATNLALHTAELNIRSESRRRDELWRALKEVRDLVLVSGTREILERVDQALTGNSRVVVGPWTFDQLGVAKRLFIGDTHWAVDAYPSGSWTVWDEKGCSELAEGTVADDIQSAMVAADAAASRWYDLDEKRNPIANFSLTLVVRHTDDPEITCIFCSNKKCDGEFAILGDGKHVAVGVHTRHLGTAKIPRAYTPEVREAEEAAIEALANWHRAPKSAIFCDELHLAAKKLEVARGERTPLIEADYAALETRALASESDPAPTGQESPTGRNRPQETPIGVACFGRVLPPKEEPPREGDDSK